MLFFELFPAFVMVVAFVAGIDSQRPTTNSQPYCWKRAAAVNASNLVTGRR